MSLKFADLRYFGRTLKERLGQLGIREWINRHPKIIIGITVVSVSILLIIVVSMLTPKKIPKVQASDKAWFYDLNTDELFAAKSNQVAPIEAPSGPLPNGKPAGVKAYVFTYVNEPNESELFIGFLEIADPQAKEETTDSVKTGADSSKSWGYGKLIRQLEDEYWVPADSDEGRAILTEATIPNENGESARYFPPK